MDLEQIKAAADLLAENRLGLQRLDGLPPELRPADESAAYALQGAVNERLEAAFGRRGGWKIGCTTATMQRFLGIPQPCARPSPAVRPVKITAGTTTPPRAANAGRSAA